MSEAAALTAERPTGAPTERAGTEDLPEWLAEVAHLPIYGWALTAWRSAAAQPGAWFDDELAELIVEDWPHWATLTLDRFAGVAFRLSTWQAIVVRLLVGWQIPIEVLDPETHEPVDVQVRLFRRMLLWIPRKNGKSEFLAALALLFFVIDGVPQGEGYVFARKESQARIVFDRMAAMIARNPEFKSEVIAYRKSFYVKALAARFELLPGSLEGLHGKAPTVIVGDEMHEWKSTAIVDTLRQGTGGRLQPIELYASTSGLKGSGVGEALYEESKQIAEGRRIDPMTLAVIFAADETDDPFDEETWAKANPSLGLSPTKHALRIEANKAVGNPRALAHFKCYHLGIWIDAVTRWLNIRKWDACAAKADGWKAYPETLKGRLCYGAVDLSSTKDITAFVLVFPPNDEDPKWRVLCRFWVPELTLQDRVGGDGVPYDKFHAAIGHNGGPALETTEGDAVDQEVVLKAILEARQDYDLQGLAYDPWCAHKLVTDLQSQHGVDAEFFHKFRQGIPSFAEPSRHFELLVTKGLLDHGGHPVLRWMAQNVAVRFDDNLNFMPAKKRSAEKVDGIVTGVMAVGVALAGVEPDDGPSVHFM